MRIHEYPMFHKDFRVTLFLRCIPVLIVLLCTPRTLFADLSTLGHIAAAEHEISYVGVRLHTFISERGTRTFEELVIHKAPNIRYGTELSVVGKRKSFDGSRDDGHQRDNRRRDRSGRGRANEQREWKQIRTLFSKQEIDLIAENYNLEKSSSTEKIANYEVDILTITPKFAGRPTKRIFFARENGVVLRAESLDAEGVLRAMLVYTRISFDPEVVARKWQTFQKDIKLEPRHSYAISLVESEKILETKPIQPQYLPPGFQLQGIRGIKDKKNTIHLIYTDGLLGFSIFETTDDRARRGSDRRRGSDTIEIADTRVQKHQRGPTHAFSWSSGDVHFFLFGAMPATELEKVVASMILKDKKK